MEKKSDSISRRSFIYLSGILIILIRFPFTACKRIIKTIDYSLTDDEEHLLSHILAHLLPDSQLVPGAEKINAYAYFSRIFNDSKLATKDIKLLKNGLRWTSEKSEELFSDKFENLDASGKESVLRKVESYEKGRRFLSLLLDYLMEALLSDPVYGGNKDESGWKWLEHIPGSPRPDPTKIYGRI